MPGLQLTARFFPVVVLVALFSFFRVEAEPAHASLSETSGPDFRSAVEKETFLLVNQYRKESDLPALTWDEAVAKEARGHSKDMATGRVDFGHEGFSDRVDRLKSVMTGLWGAGENVLMTSNLDQAARNAVTLWLHSPHHLRNIRGDYNYSGVGVWQDKNGVIYFTQLFVQIKASTEETEAEPPSSVVSPIGLLATPLTRTAR